MISIIISGIMLAYEKEETDFARKFFVKLAGKKREEMTVVVKQTVQNVVKGILGVAAIQTIFVGIGLLLAGIPFAGLWIILSLILAIVQIGILPVSIGVIIYIWSTGDTVRDCVDCLDASGWSDGQCAQADPFGQRCFCSHARGILRSNRWL